MLKLGGFGRLISALWLVAACIGASGCSSESSSDGSSGDGGGVDGGARDSSKRDGSGGDTSPTDVIILDSAQMCDPKCADDFKAIVGCNDVLIQQCGEKELCANGVCKPACEAVQINRSSVGCEYYPTVMDIYTTTADSCFAVFVANTWETAARIKVSYKGADLPVASFARIPQGTGAALTYGAYDEAAGLPPGQVAILFLHGHKVGGTPPMNGNVGCPSGITAAVVEKQLLGTGIGNSFRLTTDVPVVAYQIYPYGGGSAAVTGASLLLPTSAWDTNYVAVNAYLTVAGSLSPPSLNLIAKEDNTVITLLPKVAVQGGTGVTASAANTPMKITLNAGQQVQISQVEELTGSPIEATKPIGMMAGHACMAVPVDKCCCDHAEQQIPPVRAMGHEYACVTHRQRTLVPENPPWRVIAAVPDTQLTFDPPSVHGPVTVSLGDVLELTTAEPFVVRSQGESHPFVVTTYMTGSTTVGDTGYGDADFVRIVPPAQYLNRYVFFTDPTYPETNLVVVRSKDAKGDFKPVSLGCSGELAGWQPVGTSGKYEFTRTDLIRQNFQGQNGCSNGRHEMQSSAPFGLWIWGWGSSETSIYTSYVSYGYPAGENVRAINEVYVPPVPK